MQWSIDCWFAQLKQPQQWTSCNGISAHPEFSLNCREELDGHVACVKLFLEQHVVHGEPYVPGSEDDRDRCRSTRSLYMRCMQNKKNFPQDSDRVAHLMSQPLRCMYGTKLGLTDRWGGERLSQQLEKNISHLQVRLDHK
ncbi:jmjC domain-containing protein, putative [Eimeria acervulina]|uniref:JmjC domain-containing protein, putative n=1 Tax=Eimeria acervulina TaxID=5801 RepID=U6GUS8_EIMAC|nr:jmjC domain-containing protein, putative [Eimeria acervulina]CDI83945.1 jmjC domain-containing protein, putative [Eimeria acervulina]